MNNCFDFSRGVNHCKEEIKDYVERNKELGYTRNSHPVYDHTKTSMVIGVDDFLEWLDKI